MVAAVDRQRCAVGQPIAQQPRERGCPASTPTSCAMRDRRLRRPRGRSLVGPCSPGCPESACRRARRSAPASRGRWPAAAGRPASASRASSISKSSRPASARSNVGCARLAVVRRIDVTAAGQQEAVQRRRRHRPAVAVADRARASSPPARARTPRSRQSCCSQAIGNDRHASIADRHGSSSHPRRHGDAHQVERARQLVADVDHAGGAPPARVVALLVEDRTAGECRSALNACASANAYFASTENSSVRIDLLDDLVEPRRFEDQRPQLVAAVLAGQFAGGDDRRARRAARPRRGRRAPAASGRCCRRARPRTGCRGRSRPRS